MRGVIAVAVILPAVSACAGNLSALQPAGPAAHSIALLWWIMLVGSVVIFFSTCAALAVAWRWPRLFGRDSPKRLILWGGLVLPSIILVALVIASFVLGERLIGTPGSTPPARVQVEARQWQWEISYPDAPGTSSTNVVHIPAGVEVEFTVTSADVIHSFWVPRLGGKIDAVPGHINTIRLQADRAGNYGGVCAEFCGDGHGSMDFEVVAHPADEYEALLRQMAGESPQ